MREKRRIRSPSRPSALVADGAVLRFVVVERHFEHVVAADADAVNLRLRLAVARLFGVFVGGMRLAHGGILSWPAQFDAPVSSSGCLGVPGMASQHPF